MWHLKDNWLLDGLRPVVDIMSRVEAWGESEVTIDFAAERNSDAKEKVNNNEKRYTKDEKRYTNFAIKREQRELAHFAEREESQRS